MEISTEFAEKLYSLCREAYWNAKSLRGFLADEDTQLKATLYQEMLDAQSCFTTLKTLLGK